MREKVMEGSIGGKLDFDENVEVCIESYIVLISQCILISLFLRKWHLTILENDFVVRAIFGKNPAFCCRHVYRWPWTSARCKCNMIFICIGCYIYALSNPITFLGKPSWLLLSLLISSSCFNHHSVATCPTRWQVTKY